MSTLNFNAFHASTTVPSVQVKPTAPSVLLDSSFKIPSVSPDAMSDTSFQELSVKSVKMVAHIVIELDHVLSVRLEDMPTTDCAMSTAHLDLLLKSPT
jgi:hypothetical protein